jgi:DNA-binding SARP family transcriptional activator
MQGLVVAEGEGRPVSGLRVQILGPLRLWRNGIELDPGSRQQALLLALLLARVERPTSKNELIDFIWGDDAPESARNVIHKYVGTVRRLLEPRLPARATGSYLLPRGDGYLCAAGAETLDLVAFRELVGAAEAALAEERREVGLDQYVGALALWNGRAGDGLDQGPATLGVFTRMNNEFFGRADPAP